MDAYTVPQITRNDKTAPSFVANLLAHSGYHFFYNTETGDYLLKHNGGPYRAMDGDDEHNLKVWAIKNGIKPSVVKYAIAELADLNRISLIRDSLLALRWDGVHRIVEISESFITYGLPNVALHYKFLTAWMLGAVGKVLGSEQNPVLVIEGNSGIGKSRFARWLGSGVESAFLSEDLRINNKRSIYNAQRYFVWEITNLDSIKKSDIGSFKSFITREESIAPGFSNPRKLNASFIATAKIQKHDCMTWEMGSRRFLIIPTLILSDYYTNFDPQQVWAEAVARWLSGERASLSEEDIDLRDRLFESRNPYSYKPLKLVKD